MFRRSCCFVLVLLYASKPATGGDNSSLYRLPRDVLPESYDILLLTNVTRADFEYSGVLKLRLKVVNATSKVVVHAEKLSILAERTILQRASTSEAAIRVEDQVYDEETQLYEIRPSRLLPPGKYLLTLGFRGRVLDDLFGFYRSSYRANSQTRWLGVTQFSPTFARRAFPCMDEPAFKATFQLSLGHYENETVTSNTFIESTSSTDRPGYRITRFSRTPRMSTYLLGWSIHDFKRVNSSDPRIWLWSRYSTLPATSSVLVEAPRIYSALERWMSVKNPVDKIEHFAVPDFNFHAMENWGFITFRESVPLAFEESTPLATINDNLMTLGHEYAHTWFGNLVTPSFWDCAWLKEGFATYFAYLIVAEIHQDWRTMSLFSLENLQESLLSDSAEHNRTMNGRGVGSPSSAKAALDFVTYKKAASIIRMTSDLLGEPLFRDAMHSYLRERQYEAATPPDLYRHLQAAVDSSPKPLNIPVAIGEMMETWANQPNYPLIRVARLNPRQIRISQELFKFDRSNVDKNTESPFWWVPVKIASSSKSTGYRLTETLHWLGPENSKTIDLPIDAGDDDWFLLNFQLKGFYRVDYDNATWDRLERILDSDRFHSIPTINRAGIIDDAFNLARADFRSYDLALKIAKYLVTEGEYEPWVAGDRAITLLNQVLRERTDVIRDFRKFAVRLVEPVYQKLSFKESTQDSRFDKMLRAKIVSLACALNLDDCVCTAKSMFDEWIIDQSRSIPANFKNFVYDIGIKHGTDKDWSKLWQRFLKTDMHVDKVPMINALAHTNNSDFVERLLEFSVQKDSGIAKQYRLSIPQKIVAKSNLNMATTLKYAEKNINKIIESQGNPFLEGILTAVGNEITTKEQLNKLSQFIEKNANQLNNAVEAGRKAVKAAEKKIISIDRCTIQVQNFLNGL